MHQKIGDLGGDLHGGNIRCMRCNEAQGGGLHPDYGIMLCANRPEPLEDTLTHGEAVLTRTICSHKVLSRRRDGTCLRLPSIQSQL